MDHLDINFVRQQFPAFSESSLKDTVFLENAGGSYICRQVVDRLNRYYRQCKVQPYYPNPVSEKAGNMMDEAYIALAKWMNVMPEDVYFGPSTSQNTYMLSQAMLGWLQEGDEIIVTNQDHEANSGVWRRLAQRGILIKEWQVETKSGALLLEDLLELISPKTKLLTFPHCSNIVAHINPVAEICRIAKEHGVRTVVDGVSFAGHGLPDVKALGADIYLFSLYKVYGPHQGVMVIDKEMASELSNQSHYFNGDVREKRLMPAGPDHAQIAAVKGVDDYFEAICVHHLENTSTQKEKAEALRTLLHASEQDVLADLLSYFDSHSQLELIGPNNPIERAPTVSVTTKMIAPHDLARKLGKVGILCGAGHFYSARLLEAMNIKPDVGVLRFSLVHYTSKEDVTRLITELDNIL
ncbi:aminotransferase class V-fold PLP-dependent enzyme [Marinomonas agarivorans]|nr:aminotransferase class V-fold PLP-dependent enzyme [Marinomonas agarivorans]